VSFSLDSMLQNTWDQKPKEIRVECYFEEFKNILTDFDWNDLAGGLELDSLANENWSELSSQLRGLLIEFEIEMSCDPNYCPD